MSDRQFPSSAKQELRSFAFLAIVVAPVLAVGIIAAYGFLVWFYQMFSGPPHV
ncbi:periplasmic nitrate reductase, NapE protein [Acidovorax sp. Be4]|uniref:Periplasmic nitrate reductase, NapE protein n=1 Tax=Acidovorax bellezanensis TaxID=2976702 RepID=A0ABT2PLF9_9BURK|nr:periplasmic nitrate reductase, NapE protein [Acidovorax sp. Be4]MCT9809948.1 periplasmic nitrate reductase, NapE protein [Acidovorax sp. Be4]